MKVDRPVQGQRSGNSGEVHPAIQAPHFLPIERRRTVSQGPLGEELLEVVCKRLQEAQVDEQQVDAGQVYAAMDTLCCGLQVQRLRMSETEWAEYVGLCLSHPLRKLVHLDPFTERAFRKPRGYAGDAQLLDFIYGREEQWPIPAGTSPLGRVIFDYTTAAPAPDGVRARREFIANVLDDLPEEVRKPAVLSVAAGHLREAILSAAVKRRKFGRFVALDADPESLEEVKRCYGFYGVEVVPASIRRIFTGKLDLGSFDLVYSTGLFDYLSQAVAQQLTWSLFQKVHPRGRLLLANFLPGIRDIGYMESYMGWKLIYRTRQEMLDVAARIPEAEVRDIRLFSEENQNILFLQITRR
jgi:extracellular factor (EF) 3-hydroxypalmitic acid methyl ester biosynthesis protein